ncbi:MAG: serine/threonine-protein kinase [Lysobacterales bacterium]|nr:serine/threonine protein kinase [Xanthomonadales bacterium]
MQTSRLQQLFDSAVDLDCAARKAFLDHECADDPALREQLRSLLAVDQRLAHTTVQQVGAEAIAMAAARSDGRLQPGQRLGAFQLCEPIGQGGMGVVYRGERVDGPVKQHVAIKVVRREYLDADVLRRFELERQTLATLDHPYIARLLDAAELNDGTPYFVMEFVAGVPITDYCAQQNLDLRTRVRLMRQVCRAVSHAHRHLIVHRDLKPGNILVTGDGLPKLLDFGIAKSLSPVTAANWAAQTSTGRLFFSPGYAAPEQFRGQRVHVGCDVYALGVLLYELLTGVRPFDFTGLSLGQIEVLLEATPPQAPSSRIESGMADGRARRRALRGDLDGIVLRCLRKSPLERYGSVDQLDEDLGRYLEGLPVAARRGHSWYRLRKFVARHRWAVSIASASVFALSLAALMLWQQNLALRQERDVSQQTLDIMRDAFAEADPIRASGADISARQILESARKRLDRIDADQPALFAKLAQSIAEVDLSLGQSDQAASLLDRARQAAVRAGWEAGAQAHLLALRARALINADRLNQAQQALDASRSLSPGDSSLEWQVLQGRLWCIREEFDRGLQMLRTVMERVADRSADDELATTVRLSLAEGLGLAGDKAAVLATLEETLTWQKQRLGDSHPQVLRTRMRRVSALRALNRTDEAAAEAASVVDQIVHVFGADTAEAALAYNAFGRTLEVSGRAEESLRAYRQALTATQRAQGLDHSNTRRVQFNLAYALQASGQHDAEAEALYREVLALTEQRSGKQSEMATYVRLYLGRFLQERGRQGEAFELLTPADGWAGLERASDDNRGRYLLTLDQLSKETGCGNAANSACARAKDWIQRAANLPAQAR